jgi:UDP-N-acetylmuramate dehydrogenase
LDQIRSTYEKVPSYPAGEGTVKLAAGWLIEQAGWKGKRVGAVGVHELQALVLVNYGGGTGKEVYDLSQEIIEDIQQKFGVSLEREVNIY